MTFWKSYQAELIQAIHALDLEKIAMAAEWFAAARREGRTIFACGNGGSASTASHLACDILKGASYGRRSCIWGRAYTFDRNLT